MPKKRADVPKKGDTHVCVVCGGSHNDSDIFRVYSLEGKKVCELCLQTTVAPASPAMYMNFVNNGKIIYEDIDKEIEYNKELDEVNEVFAMEYRMMEDGTAEKVEEKEDSFNQNNVLTKPSEINEYLDAFAVGQSEAKKVLSVAIYNHFKRLAIQTRTGSKMKKNNILLSGSTGVGKTFITSLIARKLDIPFVIADANSITQAGYVGGDVEDILENLYNQANKDLNKAQKGIVLIDEIDKISVKAGRDGGNSRDPSGAGAQQALLKLIEGGKFKVEMGQGGHKTNIMFDTTDVLFIVAGAFTNIESIVMAREIGHDRAFLGGEAEELSTKEIYQKIEFDDFEQFGIIPELLGRLPVRVALKPLTEDNLIAIMSDIEDNIVDQYKTLLAEDDVKLKVTKGALQQIARQAILNNSGARGLQGVFEELLRDLMFTAPDTEEETSFSITKQSVVDLLRGE